MDDDDDEENEEDEFGSTGGSIEDSTSDDFHSGSLEDEDWYGADITPSMQTGVTKARAIFFFLERRFFFFFVFGLVWSALKFYIC